jgi:hypothetical protein
MLDPLTLAYENVTESVGADGLAAFDAGTTSIAAAATSATKPRRFLDMCGLLLEEAPVAAERRPRWRRRLRETTLGASSLRRLCSEPHRRGRGGERSLVWVGATPGL